jgi:hypothetical protein
MSPTASHPESSRTPLAIGVQFEPAEDLVLFDANVS